MEFELNAGTKAEEAIAIAKDIRRKMKQKINHHAHWP